MGASVSSTVILRSLPLVYATCSLLCLFSRFSRVDVEQHIAACLAGDLKDFEEDDVIVLD